MKFRVHTLGEIDSQKLRLLKGPAGLMAAIPLGRRHVSRCFGKTSLRTSVPEPSDRCLSYFHLPVASALPGATFKLSAPLPCQRILRRAVSVGFNAHDDHFRVFLKKHASVSAHRNLVVDILRKTGKTWFRSPAESMRDTPENENPLGPHNTQTVEVPRAVDRSSNSNYQ
jgi:hypothetical protein